MAADGGVVHLVADQRSTDHRAAGDVHIHPVLQHHGICDPRAGADVFHSVGAFGGSILVNGIGKNVHGLAGAALVFHGVHIRLGDAEAQGIALHPRLDPIGKGPHRDLPQVLAGAQGDLQLHLAIREVKGGNLRRRKGRVIPAVPGVGIVHRRVIDEQLVSVRPHTGCLGGRNGLRPFVKHQLGQLPWGAEQIRCPRQHRHRQAHRRQHAQHPQQWACPFLALWFNVKLHKPTTSPFLKTIYTIQEPLSSVKEVPAAPRRKFVHSGRLRQHGPPPITPIGEPRAVGQAVGRVKIMFQNIYEIP